MIRMSVLRLGHIFIVPAVIRLSVGTVGDSLRVLWTLHRDPMPCLSWHDIGLPPNNQTSLAFPQGVDPSTEPSMLRNMRPFLCYYLIKRRVSASEFWVHIWEATTDTIT